MQSEDLVFLDESGAKLNMTRIYGRGHGGQGVKAAVPQDAGPNMSLLSAITAETIVASMWTQGPIDGNMFVQFIETCLAPHLSAGQTILMDNIPFHKRPEVKAAIEAKGAHLEFLPPYSPELSPIENMWSKIKSILRKLAPRTLKQFKKAIKIAFELISENDLIGWLKHCGYLY